MNLKRFTSNNDKHNSIAKKLSAASSIRSITATFFNGKQLEIQYTFDPSKTKGDRLLIAMNCLSPVFSGFVSQGISEFASISEIIRLTNMHVHLNVCSDCEYASCPCHLRSSFQERYEKFEKPQVEECEYQHFHHYCSEHVASWFENYLSILILFKASRRLFNKEIVEMFLDLDLEDVVYLSLGEQVIGKFLLAHALKME
ncbi:repeat element protein-d11.1 [Ichnoviriform fugitivi]|uniref:Repeat element protein-d11.1 n=1 Tax=Ichnoviriform fugitivi TaxID=265522 RepID=A2Q0M8_9VIRU|nr:repeat element protein-d11.1 [Ichnoviriform fugitivi]BAF45743.1 repeat element protein-d11.1 [Ichnoviriform fugitivi]